jgi:hypothetical protein
MQIALFWPKLLPSLPFLASEALIYLPFWNPGRSTIVFVTFLNIHLASPCQARHFFQIGQIFYYNLCILSLVISGVRSLLSLMPSNPQPEVSVYQYRLVSSLEDYVACNISSWYLMPPEHPFTPILLTVAFHTTPHSRCLWPCRNPCLFDVELATENLLPYKPMKSLEILFIKKDCKTVPISLHRHLVLCASWYNLKENFV